MKIYKHNINKIYKQKIKTKLTKIKLRKPKKNIFKNIKRKKIYK